MSGPAFTAISRVEAARLVARAGPALAYTTVLGADYRRRFLSPNAATALRYPVDCLLGSTPTEIVPAAEHEPMLEVFAEQLADPLRQSHFLSRITLGDGRTVPIAVTSSTVLDAAGEASVAATGAVLDDDAASRGQPHLSKRQIEVLRLLDQGLSTSEIAERLVVTPMTVRNHVAQTLRSLDAHSRLEALATARKHFLI